MCFWNRGDYICCVWCFTWYLLISRRELSMNWKEHNRGLPRQLWGWSMAYKEKLKELMGQCFVQSGLFFSFKVGPDNLSRSCPAYIFLWLWHTFMGTWTVLFHLVHVTLCPFSSQTRVVLPESSLLQCQRQRQALNALWTWCVGHRIEDSLLLCFVRLF